MFNIPKWRLLSSANNTTQLLLRRRSSDNDSRPTASENFDIERYADGKMVLNTETITPSEESQSDVTTRTEGSEEE